MLVQEKYRLSKIILIFIFSFSCLPITFIYLSLVDDLIIISYLNNYFVSGQSIFFPDLPYLNLLFFLPAEYHSFQFSLGQLIDIILFAHLYCYIDACFYHCFVKRTFLNFSDEDCIREIQEESEPQYLGQYNIFGIIPELIGAPLDDENKVGYEFEWNKSFLSLSTKKKITRVIDNYKLKKVSKFSYYFFLF